MSIRNFRRPRRWRYGLVVILVVVVLLRLSVSRHAEFDPHTTIIRNGEYRLTQVRHDGLLVIELGSQRGEAASGHFKLLGIELVDVGACEAAIRRLAPQTVRLQFDRRRIDEQGLLQAYAFVDEVLLNEELVRLGLARERTHDADFGPIVRRIKQAEQRARQSKVGIWSD